MTLVTEVKAMDGQRTRLSHSQKLVLSTQTTSFSLHPLLKLKVLCLLILCVWGMRTVNLTQGVVL